MIYRLQNYSMAVALGYHANVHLPNAHLNDCITLFEVIFAKRCHSSTLCGRVECSKQAPWKANYRRCRSECVVRRLDTSLDLPCSSCSDGNEKWHRRVKHAPEDDSLSGVGHSASGRWRTRPSGSQVLSLTEPLIRVLSRKIVTLSRLRASNLKYGQGLTSTNGE